MFIHFIKILFRNLSRQPSYSVINILGLSLGLGISLMIWIFILFELSYDRFLDDYDLIYRIQSTATVGQGEPQSIPTAMFMTGEQAYREFPEVQAYVRFNSFYSSPEVKIDDQITTLSGILFADSTFFTFFSFELLLGNPAKALAQTGSIVLSESTALRFFGHPQEAIGRMINIQGQSYMITSVMKDLPENTHMQFNAVVRQEDTPHGAQSGLNFYTYLKVVPGTDILNLEARLDQMHEEHIRTDPFFKGMPFKLSSKLINIADIHLHSNMIWEIKPNGRYRNIVIFGLLGIFILVLAVINYINLATARSTLRAREIGMRKVVGASRQGLIRQIVLESMIIAGLAFILGFAFTEVFSDFFSQTLNVTLETSTLMTARGLLVILFILLLTGLLSGLYPAFFMASFNPVKILKGQTIKGSSGQLLRRILVTFQFAITIFIISSLMVIFVQLRHMQNSNLGFEQEQVILVRNLSSGIWRALPEVRAELGSLVQVQSVAGSNFIYGGSNRVDPIYQAGESIESSITADIITIDDHFLEVMGIELLEGRNFHAGSEQDMQGAFILNQTAVQALSLEDPLHTQLDLFLQKGPLIGIVRDFHLKSLHQPIEPLVLIYDQRDLPHIYMKVIPGDINRLQEDLTSIFQEFDPTYVPDIIFLDERIQTLYQQEQNQATLLSAAALLAIIISALGVYGLAAFSAERRIKEMGIRKVLGASFGHILWIFNKEPMLLLLVSFFLAAPLSWWIMDIWLNNFVLRTNVNPLWYLLPGSITLLLSSLTISLQVWFTAKANPVNSLKAE